MRRTSAVVSKWNGKAHIGKTTYAYTMSLLEEEKPTQKEALLCLGDSVVDVSLRVNHSGSLVGETLKTPRATPVLAKCLEEDLDTSGYCMDEDTVQKIAYRYSDCMTSEKASINHILGIIDHMWLQELALHSSAELLGILSQAADEVISGASADDVQKSAVKQLQTVDDMALESMRVRYEARGSVSDADGLDGLRQILLSQLEDAAGAVRSMAEQLSDPRRASKLRETITRRLRNVESELITLSDLKTANSDIFLVMEERLDDLEIDETSFTSTVLQAARANPENMGLLKICVETLACPPGDCRPSRKDLKEYMSFLTEVQAKLPDHPALGESCRKALKHLGGSFSDGAQQTQL